MAVVKRNHGVCCGLVVLRYWGFGDFETTGRCGDTRLRRGRGTAVLAGSLPLLAHVAFFRGFGKPEEQGTGEQGIVHIRVLHGRLRR